MHDVIVIGGGVIGLTLAYELAGQGVQVAVIDQSAPGQEASWAGAGILPPGNPEFAETAEARLRAVSHRLWPELSESLRSETGIDNGFHRHGGLEVRLSGTAHDLQAEVDALHREVDALHREGVAAELLVGEELQACEPALSPALVAGYRLPEMGQVRNPRHLKALVSGCSARGVEFQRGCPADGFDVVQGNVRGVRTPQGVLAAGQFVVTSGAWTARLLAPLGYHTSIRPLRGQMVLLSLPRPPIRQVINIGPRYIVPRLDGRVLVGSTEEAAGFDKRNTAEGIAGLTALAVSLVPELAGATFERAWAGLRPQTRDGLPFLGLVPETENLFVAAGHFRSGLQMSPATARGLSQLLLGQEPCLPLEPYSLKRSLLEYSL